MEEVITKKVDEKLLKFKKHFEEKLIQMERRVLSKMDAIMDKIDRSLTKLNTYSQHSAVLPSR